MSIVLDQSVYSTYIGTVDHLPCDIVRSLWLVQSCNYAVANERERLHELFLRYATASREELTRVYAEGKARIMRLLQEAEAEARALCGRLAAHEQMLVAQLEPHAEEATAAANEELREKLVEYYKHEKPRLNIVLKLPKRVLAEPKLRKPRVGEAKAVARPTRGVERGSGESRGRVLRSHATEAPQTEPKDASVPTDAILGDKLSVPVDKLSVPVDKHVPKKRASRVARKDNPKVVEILRAMVPRAELPKRGLAPVARPRTRLAPVEAPPEPVSVEGRRLRQRPSRSQEPPMASEPKGTSSSKESHVKNPKARVTKPQRVQPQKRAQSQTRGQPQKRALTQKKELSLKDSAAPLQPLEPLFCFCKQPSSGSMIACDNRRCPNGTWFHYKCVGLTRAKAEKLRRWWCLARCTPKR